MLRRFAAVLLLAALSFGSAGAAEYFVSLDGSDDNDGLSREAAFATVQRGVDALEPGDTLTIAPGEYFESVRRDRLGSDDATTTIRAEIPGTAVLRGDVPAPEFRKLDGYRFVYVADFDYDGPAQTVNELDTLTVFQGAPNVAELEFTPGTFRHDIESRRLYLSTSDGKPPHTHSYSVSVLSGNGLDLSSPRREVGPRRVIVEGLAATGFNIAQAGPGGYGIALSNARDCVVRDCRAWMNGWGIEVSSEATDAGGNVIERCVAWANDSPFANSRIGGLIGLRHRGDVIRDSVAYLNANCGIYLRVDADPEKASRLTSNLAWGNRWNFIIKGNPGGVNISERNVEGVSATGPDAGRINPIHNLLLSGGVGQQEAPGTIEIDNEDNLDLRQEFADPDNRDYRLQATSRFRGTGPDGADRGPFPYEANIFFVRPDGDDGADGLSVANAWRTVARGTRDLRPGDTLYLAPGEYREDVDLRAGSADGEAVSIRGRGHGPVTVSGEVRVAGSAKMEFARLRFEGPVQVTDSVGIAFDHCEFAHAEAGLEARNVTGLKATHCSFVGFEHAAVALRGSEGAHLSGNLYDNRRGPAIRLDGVGAVRYSDYNAYRNPDAAWEVDGGAMAVRDLGERHDRYSRTLPVEFAAESGRPSLHDRSAFAVYGPMGNPFGPHRLETRRERLRLTSEPVVHSVSATTANIEWTTLLPSQVHLAWGETPEMENRDVFEIEYFGTYSLTGLQPGQTYYFQITALEESGRQLGQHEPTRLGTIETTGGPVESPTISFATLAEDPAPSVYYVAPDGDDANTGLDRQSAWRTIQRAADQVNVGDTVLIAGGEYEEQVRVRSAGAAGAPITFRSAPGEKVVFNGGQLNDAFALYGKRHLRFDGMYLLSMRFDLYKSADIEITRVFAGQYDSRYPPEGVLVHGQESERLLIKNSVALSGKSGPRFRNCSDVRMENCVFFRNMIYQLLFYPHRTEGAVYLTNNIFTDGLTGKRSVAMVGVIPRPDTFHEANNCFYPRDPKEEKNVILFRWHQELTFDEMREELGDTNSVLANPEFLGAADVPAETDDGNPIYPVDRLYSRGLIPLNKFFATNPEIVARGIGLQPEAFEDFHFNAED